MRDMGDQHLRITEMAVDALRESTEAYLVSLFEDAKLLSTHARRVTLFPTDMQMVLYLRRFI
jgi:histone H3/H4